jgi:ABC-2 type transport system permease protein
MNIFFHELRSTRKSTLIWAASLSAGAVLFLMMFPGFTKDIEASQKVIAGLPAVFRDALGISLKDFFTVYGFFSYFFTFIAVVAAVQAMNLGVGAISKEQSGKTIDFILSKPVSRTTVITAKILAMISSILFTNIVFSMVSTVSAKSVATGDFSAKTFLLISATMFLIQLFFLALGILASTIIPKIKSVMSVSLPTVFAFFIIGALGGIFGDTNVRYFTPFKFYDSIYIINNNSYESKFLIIEIVFIIVAITLSYVIYNRKDIRAVI